MELKDVILSTLAEMDDVQQEEIVKKPQESFEIKEKIELSTLSNKEIKTEEIAVKKEVIAVDKTEIEGELKYLNSIKERLLVLFEGFQSPNNANIEAKIDMTLNFLEYVLATISNRIETIEQGNNK